MLARQSASASRRRPRDSAVAGRRAHDYRIACDGVGPAGRQFPGSQYSAGGMPVFSRERTPRGEKSRPKGIGFYWELVTRDLLCQEDSAFFEEIATTSRSHLGSKCSHLLPQKRQKSALSARLGSQLPRLAGPGRRYRPTHVDFGDLVFCARRAGYSAPPLQDGRQISVRRPELAVECHPRPPSDVAGPFFVFRRGMPVRPARRPPLPRLL